MTEEKKKQGAQEGNQNAKKEGFDTGYSGRCLSREKSTWVKAAQAEGMKLNEWIRKTLNQATEKI